MHGETCRLTEEREGNMEPEVKREAGFESLAYAIVEQAVNDLKALINCGIVVDGECAFKSWIEYEDDRPVAKTDWPLWDGKPVKVNQLYREPGEVKRLLHFFTNGDCDKILEAVGSGMTGRQILSKVS